MHTYRKVRYGVASLAVVLGAGYASATTETPLAQNPIAIAVGHGNCTEAVTQVKRDVEANEPQSVFIAGRMLDEGLCVEKNAKAAAKFFAHAAELGVPAAQLDYVVKIGLGEGATQDYSDAGKRCRSAGLDAQNHLSDYSLGYVCTLRGLTSRLLRESLPADTFQTISGARARLEFNPASGQLFVRASSRVTASEPTVSSRIGQPLVNIQQVVDKAWHKAQDMVSKPDTTHLEDQLFEVVLDLDMTMEQSSNARQKKVPDEIRPLESWDTIHSPMPTNGT
jgi:hypothetical protein